MSEINPSNYNLIARGMDTNKNGFMDELTAADHIKAKVDVDGDGKISTNELATAMRSDAVEIKNREISQSRGFNIYVNGLETLKGINKLADNAAFYGTVYTPAIYSDDTKQEQYDKLWRSNREYSSAINQMESSLRSIRDMSRTQGDSLSQSIYINAKNALNSSDWMTIQNVFELYLDGGLRDSHDNPFNDNKPSSTGSGSHSNPFNDKPSSTGGDSHTNPFDGNTTQGTSQHDNPFDNGTGSSGNSNVDYGPDTTRLEINNRNLRSAYYTLQTSLRTIEEQTRNLPDMKQTLRLTDDSLGSAMSNVNAIKNQTNSPSQVKEKLYVLSDEQAAQVKGRWKTFGGVGAGIGVVAGGTIGYFAGGHTAKGAIIGASIGLGVAGGGGALIGNGIDQSYKNKASELKTLGNEVESYNVKADESSLEGEAVNTYSGMVKARDAHDIDNARVVDNELKGVKGRVNEIQTRTSRILDAYNKVK